MLNEAELRGCWENIMWVWMGQDSPVVERAGFAVTVFLVAAFFFNLNKKRKRSMGNVHTPVVTVMGEKRKTF